MRTVSPSEATQFQFCPKYWFYTRKVGLVPIEIGFKELAGLMGSTVGYMVECYYGGKGIGLGGGLDYFNQELDSQLSLGRKYAWGVDNYIPRVKGLIESHYTSILDNEPIWKGDCTIEAIEPIMKDWGSARQDMVLSNPRGDGIVLDWKCKLKADSDSFATSRDIDLYGNQAELYPLSWNSSDHPIKIKWVRFVYLMEGKKPIIENRLVDHRRSEQWLKGYMNIVGQINLLEQDPDSIHGKLTENPYHITPWGYPCEFRNHCIMGEHEQGVLQEFIQVEGRMK